VEKGREIADEGIQKKGKVRDKKRKEKYLGKRRLISRGRKEKEKKKEKKQLRDYSAF